MTTVRLLLLCPLVILAACSVPTSRVWEPAFLPELPSVAPSDSHLYAQIECRVIRAEPDVVDDWLGAGSSLRVAHLPSVRVHELIDYDMQHTRKVVAPVVTSRLGEEARLAVVSQRAYVQDFTTGDDGLLDLIVGMVDEGVRCRFVPGRAGPVHAGPLGDASTARTRRRVRLEGTLELTRLVDLEEVPIEVPPEYGSELTVEVPRLSVVRTPIDLVLQERVAVALTPPGERELVLLLSVALIHLEEDE